MKVYLSIPSLSWFLFPEAKRIKSYGYTCSDDLVLYELSDGQRINTIESDLNKCYTNFIIITKVLSHSVDTTLDSKSDYVNFISTYKNIRKAKDIDTKVEKLSDDNFVQFVKMTLVLGRWYREVFHSEEKTYHLYEALMQSTKDFIILYTQLRETMSPNEIFSSIITFLTRLKYREDQRDSLSDYYKKLTRVASVQSVNAEQKLLEIMKLSNLIPLENRFIGFYLSLK